MTSDLFEFAPNSESKAMARVEQGKTIFVAKPCLGVIAVSIGHDAGE